MADMQFSHYGEYRSVNATDKEIAIFEMLCDMSDVELTLNRKSDSYITAMIDDWDIVRFKFTDRAKWIMFPLLGTTKNRILTISDVKSFQDKLDESIEQYKKFA